VTSPFRRVIAVWPSSLLAGTLEFRRGSFKGLSGASTSPSQTFAGDLVNVPALIVFGIAVSTAKVGTG
jgi:hypothetical protein